MSLMGFQPGPDTDATCGATPCGVLDYVYLSQACQDYLGCADTTNGLYVGATKGGLYVTGQAVGGAVSSVVGSVTGGVASGVSSATGIPPALLYVGVAIAAFFVFKAVK